MTDAELRDAAWKELAQTTVGWDKVKGYPSAKLAGTHWGKAKGYLDMIGRNSVAPPAAPLPSTTASSVGVIPSFASVGSSGSLTDHAGGLLSGVTLTSRRFTGEVTFGASDVTLTNCLFDGGLGSTYPNHGVVTLNYCTNPASSGSGWFFEETPAGSGNPGGSGNVFLDHCLFYGAFNASDGTAQAIRPKGAGTLTATDSWFLAYGDPTAGAHVEVIQMLYGATMVATRCAFSRPPATNGTVTGVLYHENATNDGIGGSFTDCVFGGYDTGAGTWARGGGFYMIGPGQASYVRPIIYSPAGASSDAWYSGTLPVSLTSPTYIAA